MPFIVYFFLSLLVIYIPLPTFFLLVNRLAEQHDTITALTKLCLLLFVCLDYFTSYYWLKQTRVKKRYYFFLVFFNLFEFLIHFFLLHQYHTIYLWIIWVFQVVVLFCMFTFPFSRKFRETLFY
ncbi:TPA: hypothetical protein OT907_001026 [Enterococcus faecium]|uniref:hypothetical protein n=1 Tax=Enterococcus faecium TaxID=1352 RepID=UPI00115A7A8A|nr:hypothetical protein [Enterococcus faecium]EGP4991001.1 hypothetical protein [Enterococcus faecium]EHG8747132.1 hypothetical protein [Enterococcus faecium]EME3440308.1 hypothetical protein [Enterococcus faecium]MCL6154662.1 hypothetical protein [Enterococcus faecium]MDV7717690.1 hypothetical protein [Enterococcus faecium]